MVRAAASLVRRAGAFEVPGEGRGECPCARAPPPDCPPHVAGATGNSDGTWKVGLPVEEVPPELPEPALGINFARDGMAVRAPAHPGCRAGWQPASAAVELPHTRGCTA